MNHIDLYEYIEMDKNETDNTNVCEYCGRELLIGFEEYEYQGFIERRQITYCPRCN